MGSHDAQNYPDQSHMNSQQYNTYHNQNPGNNWNHQQTHGNNWNIQGSQGNNRNNQSQGRTWYNNSQNQNNENHQDQTNGRGFQGACFVYRKRAHKAENYWHHPENAHQRPQWRNNTQNSPLIQNNMGNQSQDVRSHNNNTQSQTQNKTRQ